MKNVTANIILNGKVLNIFTLRLIIKQECLPRVSFIYYCFRSPPSTRREEKEMKYRLKRKQ